MKSQAQILLIGKDETLLHTRQLILGTFFQVKTAGRVSHATGILAGQRFDLIVLCDLLSDEERRRVDDLIQHQKPATQILNMRDAGHPDTGEDHCAELSSESDSYILIRKCAEMLGVELKSFGRLPRQPLRRKAAFRA